MKFGSRRSSGAQYLATDHRGDARRKRTVCLVPFGEGWNAPRRPGPAAKATIATIATIWTERVSSIDCATLTDTSVPGRPPTYAPLGPIRICPSRGSLCIRGKKIVGRKLLGSSATHANSDADDLSLGKSRSRSQTKIILRTIK